MHRHREGGWGRITVEGPPTRLAMRGVKRNPKKTGPLLPADKDVIQGGSKTEKGGGRHGRGM